VAEHTLVVPATGERVRAVQVAAAEAFGAWHAQRAADVTALAVTAWPRIDGEVVFSRFYYGGASPAAVIAGSRAVDPASVFDAWREEELDSPDDGSSDGTHLDWYEPIDPVLLAYLPVEHPEDALAYTSFYGADGPGRHERLIAILRGWRERFGATLWANWGTMLQFVVDRPPADLDAALPLAREHVRLAPSTTALPGVSTLHHARALVGRATWCLHERP
jgi:uncharacterized protein DUF4253